MGVDKKYGKPGELELLRVYNCAFSDLERAGYIIIKYNPGTRLIKKILLNQNIEQLAIMYNLETSEMKSRKIKTVLDKYYQTDIHNFVLKQYNLLQSGKIAEHSLNFENFEDILRGANFVLSNSHEITLREASISLYNNSKRFESILPAILDIVRYEEQKTEEITNDDLLAIHEIYRNPIYVCIKGNFTLYFKNGTVFQFNRNCGSVQFEKKFVDNCINKIECTKVLSIENLTSFQKYFVNDNDGLILYLGGFSNNTNIALINKTNCPVYHFGDMDANGYKILYDLQSKINRPVVPFKMNISDAKSYINFGKPMSDFNQKALTQMLNSAYYTEENKQVFQFLLDNNKTIEQEII